VFHIYLARVSVSALGFGYRRLYLHISDVDSGTWIWIFHGNVTERGDDGGGPGNSSLFFLTVHHPEIGLSGDRVRRLVEPDTFVGSGALSTSLENPREGIAFKPGRTHNRMMPGGGRALDGLGSLPGYQT